MKLKKMKLAQIMALTYFIYSIVTDIAIWGAGFYYFFIAG